MALNALVPLSGELLADVYNCSAGAILGELEGAFDDRERGSHVNGLEHVGKATKLLAEEQRGAGGGWTVKTDSGAPLDVNVV